MTTRYMLDTNIVGYLMRGHPDVRRKLASVEPSHICISAITEAELRYGLAKNPEQPRLRERLVKFFSDVESLPWDSSVTASYANLRAAMERRAKSLGRMDMLIAAHAAAVGAILVTTDRAFQFTEHLTLEDWTQP